MHLEDAERSLRPGAAKVGRGGFYGKSIRRAAAEKTYRGVHKVRDGEGLSGFGYFMMVLTVLGVVAATGLVLWAASLPSRQVSHESPLAVPGLTGLAPLMEPIAEEGSSVPSGTVSATPTATLTPSPTRSRATNSPEPVRPTPEPGAATPRPGVAADAVQASPTPQPFPQIVIQAEDSRNELVGSQVVKCGTCDGGYRVRYVGLGNYLVMHAQVPAAGVRTMGVVYESDGPPRTLKVSVNGGPPQARQVSGSGWETPALMTFQIALPAGAVEIMLYSDAEPGVDVDKVIIQ
ncbi:hypothetical protein ACIBF5_26410 [Micromonospora sp. NPDC050417]|uniref:hypothetical protein n=1 Tax=Micromonospora sp. NPDC050417 TaxID=3364280 RepID=UPI0037A7EBD7